MKYDDDARLDTSEVTDDRGRTDAAGFGGGGLGGGGLGASLAPMLIGLLFSRRHGKWFWLVVVGAVVAFFAYNALAGGSTASRSSTSQGSLIRQGNPTNFDDSQLSSECRTGADANARLECAVVADINSVQDYWGGGAYAALAAHYRGAQARYTPVDTVFFNGRTSTGCGSATSSAGPFYCPADKLVYIDLSFYDQLRTQFHSQGGLLVDAYVLAHEYGHHVQDLLGTESRVRTRQGASSDSVRLELQADCYAGVWMNHATQPQNGQAPLITDITQSDIDAAVDTAGRIGDDYIERTLGNGTVNPDNFTHGSSAQRKKWLTVGYRTGQATRCDTFAAHDLG